MKMIIRISTMHYARFKRNMSTVRWCSLAPIDTIWSQWYNSEMVTSTLLEVQRSVVPTLTAGPGREDSIQTALWFDERRQRAAAIAREYAAVATGPAGMIDRSWSAKLRLIGSDRLSFLQGMLTQDITKMSAGDSRHAAMLDPSGHFVADVYVHALEDAVFIETDSRSLAKLYEILDRYLIMEDVAISDVTEAWNILSIQGPDADTIVANALVEPDLAELPHDSNIAVEYDGTAGFASVRSHSVVGGVDVWLPVAAAGALWKALAETITPVGELAAEILRVEAGIPRWGTELTSAVLFAEAGMEDAVSYSKGCYIGQEIVARIHARGHANRSIRGLLFAADAPVDPDNRIFPADETAEREIGKVTSVVESPSTGACLGLGYIRREYLNDSTQIFAIASTGAPCPGVVRTFPL